MLQVAEPPLPEPAEDGAALEKAKSLINRYCMEIFGQEADFSHLRHVDLAFGSTRDRAHTVEVSADLIEFRLVYQVDGEVVASLQCHNLDDWNERLSTLAFDKMIDYAEAQYLKQQNQMIRSQQEKAAAAPVP